MVWPIVTDVPSSFVCVCVCVCVRACVRACVRVCVCLGVCMCALKVLETHSLLTDDWDGRGSRRKFVADDYLIHGHRQEDCHSCKCAQILTVLLATVSYFMGISFLFCRQHTAVEVQIIL